MTTFQLKTDEPEYQLGMKALLELIEKRIGNTPSSQTIRNHIKRGTITACTMIGNVWMFRRAAVDEYIANRPEPSHGGRRDNAGRKPGSKPNAPPPMAKYTDAVEIKAEIHKRAESNEYPDDPVRLLDVLNISKAELNATAWIGLEEVRLNPAAIDRIKIIQSEQLVAIKLAKERGELVESRLVEDAWTAALEPIRTAFKSLPSGAADAIDALLWLPDEVIDRACSELHTAGVSREIIDDLRVVLTRPADHAIKVRASIDAVVQRARIDAIVPPKELTGAKQ